MEALSRAYVHAVAAFCGMTYAVPSADYGIDMTLREVEESHGGQFFDWGATLDVQLKSTTGIAAGREAVRYDLDARAYDLLRLPVEPVRVLVLVILPTVEADRLRHTRSGLTIGGRAYWASLRGLPPVQNRSSVRIRIPRRQAFTHESLRWIMGMVRLGRDLR